MNETPKKAAQILRKALGSYKRSVERFLAIESSSGILLLLSTLIALFLANTNFNEIYLGILNYKIFNLSILLWINDVLMVIFFFMVGMEIKKEIMIGELSQVKKAILPIAAAIGGMIAPALIYHFFNPEYPNAKGWGIPMATDIAFAVGVLTFYGKKVPLPLKIFLLALAIIDDLGAVIVIALFYTSEVSGPFLALAAASLGVMFLLKASGVRSYLIYTLIGVVVWFGIFKSGVHATIAGVLIGLMTPVRFPTNKTTPDQTYSPLDYLVHKLHPWVSYGIMPIFALSNAGVSLIGADINHIISNPIYTGVLFGLVLGKPIGVFVASLIAVKFKLAELPTGTSWKHILSVGFLAGIGFTMALFISSLALTPDLEIYSKMGILVASTVSALLGAIALRFML